MADVISLILPHPPATNNLYFDMVVPPRPPIYPKHRAIRVLSQEGKAYKELVEGIVEGMTPFLGDVWVTFRWYRPRRVGDLDGIFKVILDGMKGGPYLDDKQVARIWADRFEDKFSPRVEVEIKALGLC